MSVDGFPSRRLPAGRELVVLGLNSGTSADGLDLAAVRVRRRGTVRAIDFLHGKTVPYPRALRQRVLALAAADRVTPEELVRLDQRVGIFFGDQAAGFIRLLARRGTRVDLVASHGQTIRHVPRKRRVAGAWVNGTLQIGSLEQVAARTGCVTVGDFRQADVALGGEGAPITTAAMYALFASPRETRVVVNIGGMANYFFFPAGCPVEDSLAADCGPGNSIIDGLAQRLFGRSFDRNGRLAARGKVSARLLHSLSRHAFFRSRRLSTGREEFGEDYCRHVVDLGKRLRLSRHDILATATELVASRIACTVQSLEAVSSGPTKLYLTGGGARNRFLVSRLAELLEPSAVRMIDELGIPADLVEAAGFAVMGETAVRGEARPTRFDRRDRVTRWPVSGRLVFPPVSCRK